MLKYTLRITFLCFLGLSVCHTGRAQDPNNTRLQDDISVLKKDVRSIGQQQQEIIDQLNELKRLLAANAAGRAGPQPPPSTLALHDKLFRGESGAAVAIVEYADFECPYCGKYEHDTFPQILSDYIETGKVKYFYRDLPLPMHPHAMGAARAARCAGEQGKYWEMHDSLFANQQAIRDVDMPDRAKELGLDAAKFSECLAGEQYTSEIKQSAAEAQKMGISGTPTFFIGKIDEKSGVMNVGKIIIGARPYDAFKSALDDLLASNAAQ